MALKDLVADRSKLTEAAIEQIISEYVRYDPEIYDVVLTPSGRALSNDAKVLVLLVAIAGWQYVVDDVQITDTRPAALEQMTGIPGGTLRPTLKKLKDAHLVVSASDGYAVRVANLDAVGRIIAGEKGITKPQSRRLRRTTAPGDASKPDNMTPSTENGSGAGRRKVGVPIRASLERLVDEGFFSNERALGDVVERLHEMAIIAKTTSLSGPIAELVRGGKLARKKVSEGGRNVWKYRGG